jgi:hypothetical protein
MYLHVSGKANEWVVLIGSNGKMKKAGIGLNCFRMPFDQVALFPSRVNKIEFDTQQVDINMQGVQVSGAIIWTIYREGEGPYNAYRNLGPDLRNKVPKTANDNLTSQASAIVRAVIANHKLEDLLRDRQKIRESITRNMKDLVKGWGVWLETVEINDIRILSGSLFKDLQARFREQEKLRAEIYTEDIKDKLAEK